MGLPVPPLMLAVGVVAVLAMVYVVVTHLKNKNILVGYEELTEDCTQMMKALTNAEMFRDGGDLVVSGNFEKLPTIVRFSYDENTPGMNIRMSAPATFTLSVVPKGARATEGRVLVRTPDDMFDARFTTRSDHPTQAKMFVSSRKAVQQMARLCCSSKTYLTINNGAIELSELVIPTPYTAKHVTDHFDAMKKLAAELQEMPDGDTVKIKAITKERSRPVQVAMVIGAIVAVAVVVGATLNPLSPEPTVDEVAGDVAQPPEGIFPVDARLILGLKGWRAMRGDEYDAGAVQWMANNGREPAGRIPADYSGLGNGRDVAYVLRDVDGINRVVILSQGKREFDTRFTDIVAATDIPARVVPQIQWKAAPPAEPDGDGLFVLRDAADPASGLVLFLKEGKVITGAPADYTQINLR